MTPTTIPQDELDDALALVNTRKLPRDDFSFSAAQNVPGFGPIRIVVTVERKGYPPVQYEAGHGTSWLPAFEDSLNGGTFE